jgi:hypothetical protein
MLPIPRICDRKACSLSAKYFEGSLRRSTETERGSSSIFGDGNASPTKRLA